MSGFILYATWHDADTIRKWINNDPEIAWIIKDRELDGIYEWRAVNAIDHLNEQEYALWHVNSGNLNIPSGTLKVPDSLVDNPFAGWRQKLNQSGYTQPWFGNNLPGPYGFLFAENGIEAPGSLARSGFDWALDRYKSIGKPAHPEARKWWRKLRRFLEANCECIPWLSSQPKSRTNPLVFVFPDAQRQIAEGRHRDVNPWLPKRVT